MTAQEYFGDWLRVIDKDKLEGVIKQINPLYKESNVNPSYNDIFKAFTLCSLADLKIVFLGFDPYPQKGKATGILFGNKEGTEKLSPSLEVLKESVIDYTVPHAHIEFDETLESWGKQGILMLNSALTVEVNKIGSHTMLWRPFMIELIKNLSKETTGILYVLFGAQAQTFEPYIDKRFNAVIVTQHPSYYARLNMDMPNDLFHSIDCIMIEKYGKPIKWYEERE